MGDACSNQKGTFGLDSVRALERSLEARMVHRKCQDLVGDLVVGLWLQRRRPCLRRAVGLAQKVDGARGEPELGSRLHELQ